MMQWNVFVQKLFLVDLSIAFVLQEFGDSKIRSEGALHTFKQQSNWTSFSSLRYCISILLMENHVTCAQSTSSSGILMTFSIRKIKKIPVTVSETRTPCTRFFSPLHPTISMDVLHSIHS